MERMAMGAEPVANFQFRSKHFAIQTNTIVNSDKCNLQLGQIMFLDGRLIREDGWRGWRWGRVSSHKWFTLRAPAGKKIGRTL